MATIRTYMSPFGGVVTFKENRTYMSPFGGVVSEQNIAAAATGVSFLTLLGVGMYLTVASPVITILSNINSPETYIMLLSSVV